MFLDVVGFDTGLEDPGFNGKGGGARSGSELSHLSYTNSRQLVFKQMNDNSAYIGTDARPESEIEG